MSGIDSCSGTVLPIKLQAVARATKSGDLELSAEQRALTVPVV